jgi:hypothetical protein
MVLQQNGFYFYFFLKTNDIQIIISKVTNSCLLAMKLHHPVDVSFQFYFEYP